MNRFSGKSGKRGERKQKTGLTEAENRTNRRRKQSGRKPETEQRAPPRLPDGALCDRLSPLEEEAVSERLVRQLERQFHGVLFILQTVFAVVGNQDILSAGHGLQLRSAVGGEFRQGGGRDFLPFQVEGDHVCVPSVRPSVGGDESGEFPVVRDHAFRPFAAGRGLPSRGPALRTGSPAHGVRSPERGSGWHRRTSYGRISSRCASPSRSRRPWRTRCP